MANDDSLFEDVPHPQVLGEKAGKSKDDSDLFEDTPHPEASKSSREVSASRAGLVGAGQGATFGFADEITSPVAAALNDPAGFLKALKASGKSLVGMEPLLEELQATSKIGDDMQSYRDISREEQKAAQEQHPGAYTTGTVAGGLLAPGLGAGKALAATKGMNLVGRAAIGSGVGAGMGGLAGAGDAEGSLEDRLPQAIEGAKTGAAVGAAIPVAGAAIGATAKLGKAALGLPVAEDLAAAAQHGYKGENLVTKAGRQEAADVVRNKSGELYNDIKSLQDDVGSAIQSRIENAQASGAKVDLSQDIPAVLEKLQKIKAEGSKEAAAYATNVESEIKKILKIKGGAEDGSFMGVAANDLPEGMVVPKAAEPSMKITPQEAQDLKQVLGNYTPRKGMAPQEIESAGVARTAKGAVGDKLDDLTGNNMPGVNGETSLNGQYGALKDSLKRLKVNEKQLPAQIQEKINAAVTKLEKPNTSGDNARQVIDDVLNNIRKVDGGEEIAAKYEKEFGDAVERLNLADKITRGGETTFSLTGTAKSLALAGSNVAGLAANKLKPAIEPVAKTMSAAKAILQSNPATQATVRAYTQGAEGTAAARAAAEPYKLQRQVASAAETADPETLKDQAQNIRTKYGQAGNQLATILDNMAGKDKDARRALMFTVLQNPAHRKMMGFGEDTK